MTDARRSERRVGKSCNDGRDGGSAYMNQGRIVSVMVCFHQGLQAAISE